MDGMQYIHLAHRPAAAETSGADALSGQVEREELRGFRNHHSALRCHLAHIRVHLDGLPNATLEKLLV